MRLTHEGNGSMTSVERLMGRLNGIKEITFRIYDTGKEPDSMGRLPLLAEGEIRERIDAEVEGSATDSSIVKMKDTVTIAENTESTIQTKEEERAYEYRNSQPIRFWHIVLGAMLGFLLYYIIRKR